MWNRYRYGIFQQFLLVDDVIILKIERIFLLTLKSYKVVTELTLFHVTNICDSCEDRNIVLF